MNKSQKARHNQTVFLKRGILHCDCGRAAVKLLGSHPVCQRCVDIETKMHAPEYKDKRNGNACKGQGSYYNSCSGEAYTAHIKHFEDVCALIGRGETIHTEELVVH